MYDGVAGLLPVKPSENLTLSWLVASVENLTERASGLRSEELVVSADRVTSPLH